MRPPELVIARLEQAHKELQIKLAKVTLLDHMIVTMSIALDSSSQDLFLDEFLCC